MSATSQLDKPKLYSLVRGLSADQKKNLADEIEISVIHLNRLSHTPGKIPISYAEIIYRHLVPVYGEAALDGCFAIPNKTFAG